MLQTRDRDVHVVVFWDCSKRAQPKLDLGSGSCFLQWQDVERYVRTYKYSLIPPRRNKARDNLIDGAGHRQTVYIVEIFCLIRAAHRNKNLNAYYSVGGSVLWAVGQDPLAQNLKKLFVFFLLSARIVLDRLCRTQTQSLYSWNVLLDSSSTQQTRMLSKINSQLTYLLATWVCTVVVLHRTARIRLP